MSRYVMGQGCTGTARLQTEAACQTISTRADLAATFFSPLKGCLAAGKKRQRQNRLPDLIFYDHHQSRIVLVRIVVALFSQLLDCVLGMRKCRRYIRQVCASRVILDPCPSAYRKEILRHSTFAHYVEDQPRYRDRMAVFSQVRLNHQIAGCGGKPR